MEENKSASSKQQEIESETRRGTKLNVWPKFVEDEIKRLAVEELGLPKTRGRPKKLSHEQQKELEKTTAKVRKIVEAIREGKEPKTTMESPN